MRFCCLFKLPAVTNSYLIDKAFLRAHPLKSSLTQEVRPEFSEWSHQQQQCRTNSSNKKIHRPLSRCAQAESVSERLRAKKDLRILTKAMGLIQCRSLLQMGELMSSFSEQEWGQVHALNM